MRVAVLIIGLLLSVGLFLQSLAGNALTSIAEDEGGQGATAIGVFMALIWVVASAIVIAKPRISMVLFGISAVFGVAGWSDFPDLKFWSGVAVFLAVLSYLGYRGKMKQQAKEAERDATMQQLLANQAAMASAAPVGTVAAVTCPNCGSMERPGARFCGSCGGALPA